MAEKNGAHSVVAMQGRELLTAEEQLNAAKDAAQTVRDCTYGDAFNAYQDAIKPLAVARDEVINAAQAAYHTAVEPHAAHYRAVIEAADQTCSVAYHEAIRDYKETVETVHDRYPFLLRHMTEAQS